jgi:hypothetical protein
MNNKTRKKIRFVLIGFFIVMIPITYWIYASMTFDKATKAFTLCSESIEQHHREDCIKDIDRALKIIPWSKSLKSYKGSLLFKNGDLNGSLKYSIDSEAYLFTGMLYEYLDKPDSAKIFYHKSIIQYKRQADKENDLELRLQYERIVALLYTFVDDSLTAKSYMHPIPDDLHFSMKELLLRYDYYIENYSGGGYRDYLYGETVCMTQAMFDNSYRVDSLLKANRILYDSEMFKHINDSIKLKIYEFKAIFKDKATKIGFREVDCEF